MDFEIREARKQDVGGILALIKELAEFENAPEKVVLKEEALLEDGFGKQPAYKAFVAEINGELIGFTLSFVRYSTWRGRVLYVEDIYVKEQFRGLAIGSALFNKQIDFARENTISNLCFQVLDWNISAINFYKKYQVEYDSEWINGLIAVPNASNG
jgi:GNAT superfamily N-acetyltransferase